MSFPTSIVAATPAGTETLGLGDDRIRELKQFIVDIFSIPDSTSFSAPIATAGATGGFGLVPLVFLTNRTGVTLVVGDVVAVDAGSATSVELGDVIRSKRVFAVARSAPADLALGVFAQTGVNPVKVQGTVAIGRYLVKSATTRALEDSGISVETGGLAPPGAVAVSLSADAAGLATALLLGPVGAIGVGDVGCRVNGAALALTTATLTAIPFNAERYDALALHDTATNNTRITPPVAGKYGIGGSAQFEISAVGSRELWIRLNGTTPIAAVAAPPGFTREALLTVHTEYDFNGTTDYVELCAYQNSGGNLNVEVEANSSPEFWARLIVRA
jgi:hypothetical protein